MKNFKELHQTTHYQWKLNMNTKSYSKKHQRLWPRTQLLHYNTKWDSTIDKQSANSSTLWLLADRIFHTQSSFSASIPIIQVNYTTKQLKTFLHSYTLHGTKASSIGELNRIKIYHMARYFADTREIAEANKSANPAKTEGRRYITPTICYRIHIGTHWRNHILQKQISRNCCNEFMWSRIYSHMWSRKFNLLRQINPGWK